MNTKKRFKVAAYFLVLFLTGLSGYAQEDAIAALQKIYKGYTSSNTLYFSAEMKMFAKNEPSKILDEMQSNYTIQGNQFLCKLGPVSMLLNEQYYISIDNSEKTILIGRKKNLPNMAGNPVLNLEKLKENVRTKKLAATLTTHASTATLSLEDKQAVGGFIRYQIEFSTATGYMKNVRMESKDEHNQAGNPMILEIHYSTPSILPQNREVFSEKKFFSIVNNKIQVSSQYKNYQIVNQL